MHPFLPLLSVVFLLAAGGVAVFLRLNRDLPEAEAFFPSLFAVALISLVCGGGLALWLRRFGLRYPTWIAIATLVLFAAARIF